MIWGQFDLSDGFGGLHRSRLVQKAFIIILNLDLYLGGDTGKWEGKKHLGFAYFLTIRIRLTRRMDRNSFWPGGGWLGNERELEGGGARCME